MNAGDDIYNKLDEIIALRWENEEEIHIHLNYATQCYWAGELKHIPKPNSPGVDIGITYYATGCISPEQVIERLLNEFLKNG